MTREENIKALEQEPCEDCISRADYKFCPNCGADMR